MHEILFKYLVLNEGLAIPQLGHFVVSHQSAFYTKDEGLLYPPIPVFCFTEEKAVTADPAVITFLAKEMNVEESRAAGDFARFSERLTMELDKNGFLIFPNLGKLEKEDGALHLTPINHLQDLLPVIQTDSHLHIETLADDSVPETNATETIPSADCISIEEREAEEHAAMEETQGKDRWWVYAIVLTLMGALALLFYYQ